MRKFVYYNEIDPKKAAWLRELIKAKLITDGEVDERSIEDVLPADVTGFARCHWFAGIGVWDYALNRAGYDRWSKVTWTGSCPCQPFSQAGTRKGAADERHLWPAFHWLIRQCRPDVVFGEQVASKDGLAWFDVVQSDLEAAAYAVGALDLCAAGFGAPHIRQRVFFVADSASSQQWRIRQSEERNGFGELPDRGRSTIGSVAESDQQRRQEQRLRNERRATDFEIAGSGKAGQLDDAFGQGLQGLAGDGDDSDQPGRNGADSRRSTATTGALGGFWRDIEWLYCRDGKYRPTQPGLFPLAHGVAARVVKLRGIGDAVVAPVAEAFIRAYMTGAK